MVLNYPWVEDEIRGRKHGREISRMPEPLSDPKVQESDTSVSVFVTAHASPKGQTPCGRTFMGRDGTTLTKEPLIQGTGFGV